MRDHPAPRRIACIKRCPLPLRPSDVSPLRPAAPGVRRDPPWLPAWHRSEARSSLLWPPAGRARRKGRNLQIGSSAGVRSELEPVRRVSARPPGTRLGQRVAVNPRRRRRPIQALPGWCPAYRLRHRYRDPAQFCECPSRVLAERRSLARPPHRFRCRQGMASRSARPGRESRRRSQRGPPPPIRRRLRCRSTWLSRPACITRCLPATRRPMLARGSSITYARSEPSRQRRSYGEPLPRKRNRRPPPRTRR